MSAMKMRQLSSVATFGILLLVWGVLLAIDACAAPVQQSVEEDGQPQQLVASDDPPRNGEGSNHDVKSNNRNQMTISHNLSRPGWKNWKRVKVSDSTVEEDWEVAEEHGTHVRGTSLPHRGMDRSSQRVKNSASGVSKVILRGYSNNAAVTSIKRKVTTGGSSLSPRNLGRGGMKWKRKKR